MSVLFGETIMSNAGMQNGKLSVTVASNNLTVAIKTQAGSDPSSSDPVYIRINGTLRTISAALSITLNAGTNWFNAGGSELATLVVPYFVYLVWDSNSGAVALSIARKSHYRIVASGMSTTTSEDHLYGYSGYTDGDDLVNVGYFEATLSAGAGYTWTVPTFTHNNLRHEPTFYSQWITWSPQVVAGNPTYGSVTFPLARYRIGPYKIDIQFGTSGTASGSAGTNISFTLPMESAQSGLANPPAFGAGWTGDGNVACQTFVKAGTPDQLQFFKYNLANFTNSTTYTMRTTGYYEIG